MAPKKRWRRVGKLSGPANVLDARWEVKPGGPGRKWIVVDRSTGQESVIDFDTMRLARQAAEWYAAAGHFVR